MLPDEIKTVKSLCSILDPEDAIKILKVSQESYLIYEGSPSDSKGITKAVEAFTKFDSKDYGTAYGDGIKKALLDPKLFDPRKVIGMGRDEMVKLVESKIENVYKANLK